MISGALHVAVEEVNADPNILPNHKLIYIFNNTCGDEKQSKTNLIFLYKILKREMSISGPLKGL